MVLKQATNVLMIDTIRYNYTFHNHLDVKRLIIQDTLGLRKNKPSLLVNLISKIKQVLYPIFSYIEINRENNIS